MHFFLSICSLAYYQHLTSTQLCNFCLIIFYSRQQTFSHNRIQLIGTRMKRKCSVRNSHITNHWVTLERL